MSRQNRIFRNAMFFEVMLEVVGIFMDWPSVAEIAVVALVTTAILWQLFLSGEQKRGERRCNSR